MGTEMTAFIEYDRDGALWREFPPEGSTQAPPPFCWDAVGEPYSVTGKGGIYTVLKDYLFFGAIAGVRNEINISPLFPPRGLPPNLSPETTESLHSGGKLGDYFDSWLKPSEINAALDHQRIDRNLLSFETHTILAIMENLTARVGDDRVRLVFGFDS